MINKLAGHLDKSRNNKKSKLFSKTNENDALISDNSFDFE